MEFKGVCSIVNITITYLRMRCLKLIKMEKILYSIVLAVMFTACGEKISELEQSKKDKKVLLDKIGKLRTEVRTIDEVIKKLDTNAIDKRVAVSVQSLKKNDFTSYVEVHGVVQSNQTISIMPELSGIIKKNSST